MHTPQNWTCPHCNAYNPPHRRRCWQCGCAPKDFSPEKSTPGWRSFVARFGWVAFALGYLALFSGMVALTLRYSALHGRPSTRLDTNAHLPYTLAWKVDAGHPLVYEGVNRYAMSNVSIATGNEAIDPGANEMVKELLGLVSQAGSVTVTQTYSTTLSKNDQGNIAVDMLIKSVDQGALGLLAGQAGEQAAQSAVGTVFLHSEVTPDGKILPYYVDADEKNLLSLYFQLPGKPVKVGDSWPVDTICVRAGSDPAQFVVETSERESQVTFMGVSKTATDEPVAVLDYHITERLTGKQSIPALAKEPVQGSFDCVGSGQGEFLIEQGRWKNFSFEFVVQTTGLMSSTLTQSFALSPMKK